MPSLWKGTVRGFKSITGIKSITGKKNTAEAAEIMAEIENSLNIAEIYETEYWSAEAKTWKKVPYPHTLFPEEHRREWGEENYDAPFTFENDGNSNSFPGDNQYLSQLPKDEEPDLEGRMFVWAFADNSKWEEEEWVEGKDFIFMRRNSSDGNVVNNKSQSQSPGSQDTNLKTSNDNNENEKSRSRTANNRKKQGTRRCRKWVRDLVYVEGTINNNKKGNNNNNNNRIENSICSKAEDEGKGDHYFQEKETEKDLYGAGSNLEPISEDHTTATATEAQTSTTASTTISLPSTPRASADRADSSSSASAATTTLPPLTNTSVPVPKPIAKDGKENIPAYLEEVPMDGKLAGAFRFKDKKIYALATQIRALEGKNVQEDKKQRDDFDKYQKPVMVEQVAELEKKVLELKTRLAEEMHVGLEHAAMLEEEISAHTESLEDVKKKMYFPFSTLTLGAAGMYCACDDFWLENMKGYLVLEVQPSKTHPSINLVLQGTAPLNDMGEVDEALEGSIAGADDESAFDDSQSTAGSTTGGNSSWRPYGNKDTGLEVRFKLEKFKSNGDKGTKVPKAGLNELKITLGVSVNLQIIYDVEKKVWTCDKEHLNIELKDFKGPFGTRRSMAATALKMCAPVIRAEILKVLPRELGEYISTLPSPFEIRGSFCAKGTELRILQAFMPTAEYVRSRCDMSKLQLGMFWCMQYYTMSRPVVLKSIAEVIGYMRFHRRYTKNWRDMCVLWDQCCSLYCEQIQLRKSEEAQLKGALRFDSRVYEMKFKQVLQGAEEIDRKQIQSVVKISKLEGQFSFNKALRCLHQFLYRITYEDCVDVINKGGGAFEHEREAQQQQETDEFEELSPSSLTGAASGMDASPISPDPQRVDDSFSLEGRQSALDDSLMYNSRNSIIGASVMPTNKKDTVSLSPRNEKQKKLSKKKKALLTGYNIKRAKAILLLNRIADQYDKGLEVIKNFSRNFDFGEMQVSADFTSGPEGHARADVRTMFTQFPLLLDTGISKDKQIWGTVVPFKFAMRPQSSGDLHIELSHVKNMSISNRLVTGSAVEVSGIAPDVTDYASSYAPSTPCTRGGSQGADEVDVPVICLRASRPHISIIVDQKSTLKPGAELFSLMIGPRTNRKKPFGAPDMVKRALEQEQEYEQSLPPLFDMIDILDGVERGQGLDADNNDDNKGGEASLLRDDGAKTETSKMDGNNNGKNGLKDEDSDKTHKAASSKSSDSAGGLPGQERLSIGERMSLPKKEELTAQGLDMLRIESLKNGEDLALRSVVRDRGSLQAASLSTKDTGIGVGADIEAEVDLQGDAPLSLAQGQKRPKSPTIRHRADVASRLGVDLMAQRAAGGGNGPQWEEEQDCPLFLQTAPGIKMLMQVPRVLVHTDVPSLVAFVDAHFEDLPVLKDWLEETFGMDLLEEHLSLLQTVLVRANKYLVQPSHAVEAQMNLKLKVVSQAYEILCRFETPMPEEGFDPVLGEIRPFNAAKDREHLPPFAGFQSPGPSKSSHPIPTHTVATDDTSARESPNAGEFKALFDDLSTKVSTKAPALPNPSVETATANASLNANLPPTPEREETKTEARCALCFALRLNVQDVIEDLQMLSKSMIELKQAQVEVASKRAEQILTREQDEASDMASELASEVGE